MPVAKKGSRKAAKGSKKGSRRVSRRRSPAGKYCSLGKRRCAKTSDKAKASKDCRMTRSMRNGKPVKSCRKIAGIKASRYGAMRAAEAAIPRRSRRAEGGRNYY